MSNETNKPFTVNDRTVPARMTKHQKLILGMGLAFLVVGIIVFIILRMMEGNIILQNGQEYVYTVDPNVYLVMLVIALIGILIILLTFAEYRWQSRGGETEVSFLDLIHRKERSPVQKRTTSHINDKRQKPKRGVVQGKMKRPEPPSKKAPEPVRQNVPEKTNKKAPEPVRKKELENIRMKKLGSSPTEHAEPVLKKEPSPIPMKQTEPPVKTEPDPVMPVLTEPVPVYVPEPIKMEPEPAHIIVPVQMNLVEPAKVTAVGSARTEKIIPIRVAALGRCPRCGKVIVLGQTECFKCGWKVEPGRLVPFEREIVSEK